MYIKGGVTMSILTVTQENFETEILQSTKPVLLDFWAPWCAPCRMIAPVVEQIADEISAIKVGKVNVDDCPELAARYGVMTIPTLIVMKDGAVTHQTAGFKSKPAIIEMLAG